MTRCEHFRRLPLAVNIERCITCGWDVPAFTTQARRAADRRNAAVDELLAKAEDYYRWSRRLQRFPRIERWLRANEAECRAQAFAAEREPLAAWEGRTDLERVRDLLRGVA